MLMRVFLAVVVGTGVMLGADVPELKTEAVDGGSVFHVKNTSAQPLTAYLIELVGYPGSSFTMWQDDLTGQPLAPGGEKSIRVTNMTAGAVPDYVKLRAALYADGTSAGDPERVAQFIARRKHVLETVREALKRAEKAGSKDALVGDFKQWSNSIPAPTKANFGNQNTINQAADRTFLSETVRQLDSNSLESYVADLRAIEKKLAASKPPL